MKLACLSAIITVLVACYARAATNSTSLVVINSADYGYTNSMMIIAEIERGTNTSKLKLSSIKFASRKRESSVGSSMFIMRGFYEVAKARGTEYFINLKEWDEPDGSRLYIRGFTNTKDADIHKEFGNEYALTNDYGESRGYMSVSQCSMLFEKRKKLIIEPANAAYRAPRSGRFATLSGAQPRRPTIRWSA